MLAYPCSDPGIHFALLDVARERRDAPRTIYFVGSRSFSAGHALWTYSRLSAVAWRYADWPSTNPYGRLHDCANEAKS